MKVQRTPVKISKHGMRAAVVMSPEEYDQFIHLKSHNNLVGVCGKFKVIKSITVRQGTG